MKKHKGNSLTQNLEQGDSATASLVDNSCFFLLGAELKVSANQEVGAYSGTFDLQIDY
ncbi:MAG: DUF4402 domain-containing protein [bacterium]